MVKLLFYPASNLMSAIVDCHRGIWVDARYRETVELFHDYRKQLEYEHLDLVDLSRVCAGVIFRVNAGTIVGNREKTARAFMKKLRENISDEINNAILEPEAVEEMVC